MSKLSEQDKRPMRGGWAPGSYNALCHKCGHVFIGDKRAIRCADCAYSEPEPAPLPTFAESIAADPIADAYRAGRIAQAEEDAKVADRFSVGNTKEFDEIDMGKCISARTIAAAIRANAERLRAGNEGDGE